MTVCPHCHQHIAVERLGVRLTPTKARIVDAIVAAGDPGISSPELAFDVYRGQGRVRSRHGMKSHVYQINILLAETDWQIASDGRGPHARWYLRRRRQGRKAA